MKPPPKLRIPRLGRPLPPKTRFKQLVRGMPIEAADALFKLLDTMSQPDWRAHVAKTYGVVLPFNPQATSLRQWYPMERASLIVERTENQLCASGKSPEEARREVIKTVYALAEKLADPKLVLATMDRDLSLDDNNRKERAYGLAERKVKLLEEKARTAQAEKEPPDQATHQGGLTPETLRQIEAEADLL